MCWCAAHLQATVAQIPHHPYLGSIMSQSDKAAYYKALQAAGVTFDRHYREYTTDDLVEMYRLLPGDGKPPVELELDLGLEESEATPDSSTPSPTAEQPLVPGAPKPEDSLPGAHALEVEEGEPVRVDENGLVWYQEEIRKPSFPKPRGRRILKYLNPGVEQKQVINGDYLESFEVAGSRTTAGEIKITLPSYQVGIYKDPTMPFKIYVYNGMRGFDLFEVQDFYGGADLVPLEVKRIYVENVLCYDIRSVVRAIQTEYRQQQLAGRIQ